MPQYLKGKILSIAGSDCSGGAGIQADIKTATSLKTYIATAISCITVQNSSKVYKISYLNPDLIQKQIEAILDDLKIDIIKIGMIGNKDIAQTINQILITKAKNIPVIIDPIITSTSLSSLLDEEAIEYFKTNLIKNSYLLTPNINEAETLSGIKINNLADMELAGKEIIKMGTKNILVKGGHLNSKNKIYHLLLDSKGNKKIFSNKKLNVGNIHGTGCSLSTAIASFLSNKNDLETSIKKANQFVYKAIKYGDNIGKGSRILNHFFS